MVLKVTQYLSEFIVNTGYSMVAVCQQAVPFARGILWDLIHELTYVLERNPVHEHVDDLSQPITAPSPDLLKKKLVQAGAIVKTHVDRMKINFSDKSTVVPISVATLAAARDLEKFRGHSKGSVIMRRRGKQDGRLQAQAGE